MDERRPMLRSGLNSWDRKIKDHRGWDYLKCDERLSLLRDEVVEGSRLRAQLQTLHARPAGAAARAVRTARLEQTHTVKQLREDNV